MKLDKSQAEIILWVRQYFEKGRDQKSCSEFSQVVKRRSDTTGLNRIPSLDPIYEINRQFKKSDVANLNIFESFDESNDKEFVWKPSRSNLFRFMKSIGFIYNERVSHYKHTKNCRYVVAMRDDYLEWVEKHRKDGFSISYQDETWVFKNMTSSKVLARTW